MWWICVSLYIERRVESMEKISAFAKVGGAVHAGGTLASEGVKSVANSVSNTAKSFTIFNKNNNGADRYYTLQEIKEATRHDVNNTWHAQHYKNATNETKLPREFVRLLNYESLVNGTNKFYNRITFQDTLRDMGDRVADIVVPDRIKLMDGEQEIDIVPRIGTTLRLDPRNLPLKEIVTVATLYDKAGIYVHIKNGQYKFEILKPFEYIFRGNELIVFGKYERHIGVNVVDEKPNVVMIDNGVPRTDEQMLFYEFNSGMRMTAKIEKILEYDLASANVIIEQSLNKSKIFTPSTLWGSNPVNRDVIEMVNLPENLYGDQEQLKNTIYQTKESKFGMSDIVLTKQTIASDIAFKLGYSKKTLGIGDATIDYSNSLKYENDTTAKTVNKQRRMLEHFLNAMIGDLTGSNIMVELGNLELTSKEAIVDNNAKALNSQQMPIREAMALRMNKRIDDEEVLLYSYMIKNERNLTPDDLEMEIAGKYGLIGAVPEEAEEEEFMEDDAI